MPKPRHTIEQVEQALRHAGGILAGAARVLNVDRTTVSKRVAGSKRLQAVQKEAIEMDLDFSENEARRLRKEGFWPAIQFHLATHGKGRGWSTRQEITGQDGGPVLVQGMGLSGLIEEAKKADDGA